MKTTKFLTSAFVLGSIALGTLGQAKEAAAANIVNTYLADEAVSDEYHSAYYGSNPHNHAFWLPTLFSGGGNDDFVLDGDAELNLYDNDTINFSGTIVSEVYADKKLDFDIWFNHKPGHNTRKLELNRNNPYNTVVDFNTWEYYNIDSSKSTLTEVGDWYEGEDQEVFSIRNKSTQHITQFGKGASGKNVNMGLSQWFYITDEQGEVKGNDVRTYHGDINIDLIETEVAGGYLSESTPEPATMSLLTLGLLGTGMGALKRKNK
ncbi:PEP-CTERM sorting domain-containing protein [Dapis sp. BLCC M126]|uniref:PEP-CTERM sorting domain-containing protein n=1 Tax=Dapis sp. BLCC M126 TaxID=3400189 RepID=UPI003CEA224B